MRERQKMQTFDWVIWAALVAMGGFLGMAINGMVGLARAGSWWSIVIVLVPFGGWLVFYLLSLRLGTFISTGRFSEPKQLQKRRKPLMLLLGLPLGLLIGVIGAQFGLDRLLL